MTNGAWFMADGATAIAAIIRRLPSAIGHQPTTIQTQPPKPLIVKIIEPPHDPTGIADVLIGSLGLTGAIVLMAVVCGVLFAGVMFWFRSRRA
jgi:hypothetical protein